MLKKLWIFNICIFFILWSGVAFCENTNKTMFYVPITTKCVKQAANQHKVPFWSLITIMSVEGGSIGMMKQNTNRTYDIGPMQINTLWLEELKRYGISKQDLRFNGCLNVNVAAWILNKKLKNKNFWVGIGGYHSFTKRHNIRYRNKIFETATKIKDVNKIISRANNIKRGLGYEQ